MREHPIEVARRALLEAAQMEPEPCSYALLKMAEALPTRTAADVRPVRPKVVPLKLAALDAGGR